MSNNIGKSPTPRTVNFKGEFSSAHPFTSLTNNTDIAGYEKELQLEMDRRGNFHGNNTCCQRRQSLPDMTEEEVERRLLWARQMIEQSPTLCTRSCRLPSLRSKDSQ
jgi:hypothetical protein